MALTVTGNLIIREGLTIGHKSKKSLIAQVKEVFDAKLAIGQSKHDAKASGAVQEHIYSWGTYKSYLKHCCYFVKWCKEKYGCRTLDQCRPYADEWLETRLGLSAYTQKLEVAALAKLYSCSSSNFRKTKSRKRSEITRSRGEKARDAHFSEWKHQDFVSFCRSTGLRREELRQLRGSDLELREDGCWYIHVQRGSKGGRPRYAPVIGNVDLVIRLMQTAGDQPVFDRIPGGADIHSYRAEYATAIYKQYARQLEDIPCSYDAKGRKIQKDVYICRGDRKGDRFDKAAMLAASRALGHNRISVVGEHYLRL